MFFRLLARGWQSSVYEFHLRSGCGRAQLPVELPLILRVYRAEGAAGKGLRESRIMHRLSDSGYRVPQPHLFEADRQPLGMPFMIMNRLEGRPLFGVGHGSSALPRFAMGFAAFVRNHATLHRLDAQSVASGDAFRPSDTDQGPQSSGLLQRMLATISERIEYVPLPALRPALEWATSHAAKFGSAPDSVLHLDYLPRNAMVKGFHITGIVDWLEADVGDRHLDAANTTVALRAATLGRSSLMHDNALSNALGALCPALYVALYHSILRLDFERFRYCQGVAALNRLATFGLMRLRGAEAAGFRPQAISEVTPTALRLLARQVGRASGVPVGLQFA
ncbi:MAG TPA: phosphotransferase [Candidatus Acidoferrales bacterium]|nr:phosphotransferase [Candidatus Acidoferrales bacterium]